MVVVVWWCGGGVVWSILPIIEPPQSRLFNSGLNWVVAIMIYDLQFCISSPKYVRFNNLNIKFYSWEVQVMLNLRLSLALN